MDYNVRQMIESSPALKSLSVVYTDHFNLSKGGILNIYYDLTEEDCEIILGTKVKFSIQFPGNVTPATLKLINEKILPVNTNTHINIAPYGRGMFTDLDILSLIPLCKHINTGNISSTAQLEKINHYLTLESLSIGTERSVSLKPLKHYTAMKKLAVMGKFKDIEVIGELPGLETLDIVSMSLKELDFLVPLKNLIELSFGFGGITNLKALPMVGKIEKLSFTWVKRLMMEDLFPINNMKYLKQLSFNTIPHLTDLDWLADKSIQTRVEGCRKFKKA